MAALHFTGCIPFEQVERLYQNALATIVLLPPRYAASGRMTQRLFESVLAGCLPLAPGEIRGIERYVPADLHVTSGRDAAERIRALRQAAAHRRAELLDECLDKLVGLPAGPAVETARHALREPDPQPVRLPR